MKLVNAFANQFTIYRTKTDSAGLHRRAPWRYAAGERDHQGDSCGNCRGASHSRPSREGQPTAPHPGNAGKSRSARDGWRDGGRLRAVGSPNRAENDSKLRHRTGPGPGHRLHHRRPDRSPRLARAVSRPDCARPRSALLARLQTPPSSLRKEGRLALLSDARDTYGEGYAKLRVGVRFRKPRRPCKDRACHERGRGRREVDDRREPGRRDRAYRPSRCASTSISAAPSSTCSSASSPTRE